MNHDQILQWGREARALAENSRYAERIMPLLENPSLGEVSPQDDWRKPNCAGSVFYILGMDRPHQPGFRDPRVMKLFLEECCTKEKTPDGIVAFLDCAGENVCHSAIYLGVAAGMDTLFHQPDTGQDYALCPVSRAFDTTEFEFKTSFYSVPRTGQSATFLERAHLIGN